MEQGGLSHLMEAATALATLTDNKTAAAAAEATSGPTELAAAPPSTKVTTPPSTKRKLHKPNATTANNKEIFPVRLMAILNDPTIADDIITWLPHGRSFVIVRPDVFTEQVLPLYMPPDTRSGATANKNTTTKYPSFTRKLNRWGFRQATRGPDTGAFHHALFRRENPALCLEMVCQRSRDARMPAKKRKVAALTAASLEAMNNSQVTTTSVVLPAATTTAVAVPTTEQQQQSVDSSGNPRIATVSVSGESSSSSSSSSSDNDRQLSRQGTTRTITADTQLAERAVLQLNEQERLRTAKAMLYHAYLEAVQQPSATSPQQQP